MKFKVGDRALIISLNNQEGTIDKIDYEDAGKETRIYLTIPLEDLETINRLVPEEQIDYVMAAENRSMRYCTVEHDLLYIGQSSNPEPDWKDIWDSN